VRLIGCVGKSRGILLGRRMVERFPVTCDNSICDVSPNILICVGRLKVPVSACFERFEIQEVVSRPIGSSIA
jgi:hypothetical protein